MRSGGFGGASGLGTYLRAENIAVCIDATHPFAVRMSANAVLACTQANVPRAAYVRPEWQPVDGDRWLFVDDVAATVRLLPAMGRRVFVAFADGIEPLAGLDIAFVVRRAEPGPVNLPGARVLVQRGPFARDAERALILFGKNVLIEDELAALSVKAMAAVGLGRFDEAKAAAKRRVELCQRAERRLDEIPALRALAMVAAASGDRLTARTHLNNALKLARAASHRVEEGLLHQGLGDQLFVSGAYAEAIARYQSAATLCADTGQSLARAECLKCIVLFLSDLEHLCLALAQQGGDAVDVFALVK
jgi:precorrin-6A/cobalt-precorrin-6A reductase